MPDSARKQAIHGLLAEAARLVLEEVREREPQHAERWVPTADVRNALGLSMPSVPRDRGNPQQAWLFSTLTRMLEDSGALEWNRGENGRTYCRSRGGVAG